MTGWDFESRIGDTAQRREAILDQIQKKALSYVPEWRFTREDPDIGTALALIYGEMLSKTIKKLNEIPYKYQIAFFQQLEAELLPAVPASGFVTFQITGGERAGEEVAAGTKVLAPAGNGRESTISYETLDDIYVTPAQPDCMLQVSGQRDFIGLLDMEKMRDPGIFLFADQTENMQRHRLYFCHDDALSITQAGRITIDFLLRGEAVGEELVRMLADPEQAVFFYGSEDGYVPFASVKSSASQLEFVTGQNDPPFVPREENERESFWICCEVKQLQTFERFCFDQMILVTDCGRVMPDCIYANGKEVTGDSFFPFGEQFSDYQEVCFLSDEVFRKKGAVITLSFNLDFAKIPLDYEQTGIAWDWVMRRSDLKTDPEFDITIEEVVWEYFNGYGWTALFEKNGYADVFSVRDGAIGQYQKISFVCPQDISPVLIHAREGLYIRARILKVNNLYKMRGTYISPVMDKVHVQYDYGQRPVSPKCLITENNISRRVHFPGEGQLHPFLGMEAQESLYLGFDTAPEGGPVKILFDFSRRLEKGNRTLVWEYATTYGGWKEMDLADGTEHMSRTGIVTLMGSRGYDRRTLYGIDRYWIRIRDVSPQLVDHGKKKELPCLCGLYMNTVRIRQMERLETEYFHMEMYQENMVFHFMHTGVTGCRLWVDETELSGSSELQLLRRSHRLYAQYRSDGELYRAWVEWELVEDFLNSGSDDRHYMLDRTEGSIRFGNGKAGRIPPAARTDNIRVVYKTGGGEHTNVEAYAVNQPDRAMGVVNRIYNPKKLTGGSDAETLKDALKRNAAVLRHQNMAVTERDFEEIALEASRSLKRVKCFSGYDAWEHKKSGAVTLVLLQKDLKEGQARFYDIRMEVEHHMRDRICTSLIERNAFFCIPPQFVELRIRAEIVVESFDYVFQVKKRVLKRLEAFLNPLTGNFDGMGWEIGSLPNQLQVRNAISDAEGLSYIKNVYLSAFLGEDAKLAEVDMERVRRRKYILPVSGAHHVVVRVKA